MSAFYVDASAWVKYYVAEPGAKWMDQFFNLGIPCACSELGLVEVIATLTRITKNRPAAIGSYAMMIASVQKQFQAFNAIPLDPQMVARACHVAQFRALRGADSVHLASALHLRDLLSTPVTLIASDVELLAAATAEGLTALDPTTDPPLPTVP